MNDPYRGHAMTTDPGPKNLFSVVFKTVYIYVYIIIMDFLVSEQNLSFL